MSVLLVLLTFLTLLTIARLRQRAPTRFPAVAVDQACAATLLFHPSHTWLVNEGEQIVRVGIDELIGQLFGQFDQIEILGLERWVRQGQRLLTIKGAGVSIDLLSPVEGTIKSINEAVLHDPMLAIVDPYQKGWIARLKAVDVVCNEKALLRGPLAELWMHNSFACLNEALSELGLLGWQPRATGEGLLHLVPLELRLGLLQKLLADRVDLLAA